VIIPTCRREEMLREAVESVLGQTHPALEIIVIENGGGPEMSEKVAALAALHRTILPVRLEGTPGPGRARNEGLRMARGEFVLFLDDDDLLDPEALESSLDFFRKDPGLDVVSCHGSVFHSPSKENGEEKRARIHPLGRLDAGRLERKPVSEIMRFGLQTPSCLIRRASLGRDPFHEKLKAGEDTWLWIRLAAEGCRFRFNPEVLVHIRLHSGNLHAQPGFSAESQRFWSLLLASGLLKAGEERFLCHGQLVLMGLRRRKMELLRHLPYLVIHPVLFFRHLAMFLSVRLKKQMDRRLERAFI